MKNLLFLLIIGVIFSCGTSKKASNSEQVIFLVRHAEKADDGTKDPPLTLEGIARASKLANMLKTNKINAIFSSDFNRTKETASPLAEHLKMEVMIYNPSSFEEVMSYIASHPHENILVVGHSNSTPTLANKILGAEQYSQIDESDYTNLFELKKSGTKWESQVIKF